MSTIKDSLNRFITGVWFFPFLKKAKEEDLAKPLGVTKSGKLVKLEGGGGSGSEGPQGPPGESATITSATATSLEAGEAPTVTLGGTPLKRTFSFGIPKGKDGNNGTNGKTPVIEIGTVTTVAAGGSATASVIPNGVDGGGNPKYNVNFGIPKGADGSGGAGTRTGRLLLWIGHDSTGEYRPSTSKVNLFPTMPTVVAGDLILDKKGNYREVASTDAPGNIAKMGDILITIPPVTPTP